MERLLVPQNSHCVLRRRKDDLRGWLFGRGDGVLGEHAALFQNLFGCFGYGEGE
jgi:hypothetical protein